MAEIVPARPPQPARGRAGRPRPPGAVGAGPRGLRRRRGPAPTANLRCRPKSSDWRPMDDAMVATVGGSTGRSPSGWARSTTVPLPRSLARRGPPAVGDWRPDATSGCCAPGSTSTPATSAGCCVAWSATAWSPSGARRRRPGPDGARSRRRGRAERALLDGRSDELAAVAPGPAHRAARPARRGDGRGRAAAHAPRWSIARRPIPAHPAPAHCLRRVLRRARPTVRRRVRPGAEHPGPRRRDASAPAGLFLVALLHGEPVGCGAVKFRRREPTELKRMWVAAAARGLGLGRRLLGELEPGAADRRRTQSGWRPTARSPRRSPCTGRPATTRSQRSTTSRTPTTGSRSASDDRLSPGR